MTGIFFTRHSIFFALQASFTSVKSFFRIGIADKAIHTITFISSGWMCNLLSGEHKTRIVSATPHNTRCFGINDRDMAYQEQFNANPKSSFPLV